MKVDDVEVTADSDWAYEFTELPKYDDQGLEITYTIDVADVSGYEKSIEGTDITNLRVGTTDVSGTKTWIGDDASDRPATIVVELLRNGEVIDELDVTADTDWVYRFGDLPQYDENGVAYAYTVSEQDVEGYTSDVNGYDITNTLIPEDPKDPEDPQDPEKPENPKDQEDPGSPSEPEDTDEGNKIPKTATNVFNLMLIGFGLTLVGFVSLFFRRRKNV